MIPGGAAVAISPVGAFITKPPIFAFMSKTMTPMSTAYQLFLALSLSKDLPGLPTLPARVGSSFVAPEYQNDLTGGVWTKNFTAVTLVNDAKFGQVSRMVSTAQNTAAFAQIDGMPGKQGQMYTWMADVKQDPTSGAQSVTVRYPSYGGGPYAIATIDFSNGNVSNAVDQGGNILASGAVPLGSGWYRLWMSGTAFNSDGGFQSTQFTIRMAAAHVDPLGAGVLIRRARVVEGFAAYGDANLEVALSLSMNDVGDRTVPAWTVNGDISVTMNKLMSSMLGSLNVAAAETVSMDDVGARTVPNQIMIRYDRTLWSLVGSGKRTVTVGTVVAAISLNWVQTMKPMSSWAEWRNQVPYSLPGGTGYSGGNATVTDGAAWGSYPVKQIASQGFTYNRPNPSPEFLVVPGRMYTVTAVYRTGTSGKAIVTFGRSDGTFESHVAGNVGALAAVVQSGGPITNVVNTNLGGGVYQVTFNIVPVQPYVAPSMGPYSTTVGQDVGGIHIGVATGSSSPGIVVTNGMAEPVYNIAAPVVLTWVQTGQATLRNQAVALAVLLSMAKVGERTVTVQTLALAVLLSMTVVMNQMLRTMNVAAAVSISMTKIMSQMLRTQLVAAALVLSMTKVLTKIRVSAYARSIKRRMALFMRVLRR